MNIVKKHPRHLLFPLPSTPAGIQSCDQLLLAAGDPHAVPRLLKSAAALSLLPLALTLHQQSLVLGFSTDTHISSSLIHCYAKNGRLDIARRVFDGMPHRNIVPWSTIIAAYSQSGHTDTAFSMYNQMGVDGIRPNSVTALGLLSGILNLDHLQCSHACVIRCGFDADLVLLNSMVNVYSKCGRVDLARYLFDSIPFKDIVSWNSMLAGYSRARYSRELVDLFIEMRTQRVLPDHQTYGCLVSAVTNNLGGSVKSGKLVHSLVVSSGLGLDAHIETVLVRMYLKLGSSDDAFRVFDRSFTKDIVSWTAMISGLIQNDGADKALAVFHQMLRVGVTPETTTIASVLSACANLGSFEIGASIHGFVLRRRLPLDTAANNSLLTMYSKCSRLKQSQSVFDSMQDRDLVSWNSLISGYTLNSHLDEAFLLFKRMRFQQQNPDAITIVSLLQACASSGARLHGKSIHNFVIKHQINPCISIDTSLVDMYSKCGNLEAAQRCFESMPEHDVVSWTAIIGGYGNHGMGEAALTIYSYFLRTEMEPNDVMFVSLLSACSHSGLVAQGMRVFKSMEDDFGIVPRIEHCACVVDLLCRAGRVVEALEFIRMMSPKPSADVLGILLDACRIKGDAALTEKVAREIIAMRPECAGNYMQLAHSYAAMNRWDGVGETWAQMRNLGLRKAPGWSSIELNGILSTFFADHSSHPQHQEMLWVLKILANEMRINKDDHDYMG